MPGAAFDVELGEFVLPYRTVRESSDPDGLLLAFLQTCSSRSCRDYEPHISHGTASAMLMASKRGVRIIQVLDEKLAIG